MKKQSKSKNALMAPLCLIIDHDRARYGEFPKDELVKIGLDVTVERNQAFKDKVSIAIPDGENALELAYAIGLAVQTHFISAKTVETDTRLRVSRGTWPSILTS